MYLPQTRTVAQTRALGIRAAELLRLLFDQRDCQSNTHTHCLNTQTSGSWIIFLKGELKSKIGWTLIALFSPQSKCTGPLPSPAPPPPSIPTRVAKQFQKNSVLNLEQPQSELFQALVCQLSLLLFCYNEYTAGAPQINSSGDSLDARLSLHFLTLHFVSKYKHTDIFLISLLTLFHSISRFLKIEFSERVV